MPTTCRSGGSKASAKKQNSEDIKPQASALKKPGLDDSHLHVVPSLTSILLYRKAKDVVDISDSDEDQSYVFIKYQLNIDDTIDNCILSIEIKQIETPTR